MQALTCNALWNLGVFYKNKNGYRERKGKGETEKKRWEEKKEKGITKQKKLQKLFLG